MNKKDIAHELAQLRAEVTLLREERIPKVDQSSRRRDRRLTVAYVFVAIFAVGLGVVGTATALPNSNTVFSDDIVNGAVTSKDLKNGGVASIDLKQPAWVNVKPAATSGAEEACINGGTAQFCGVRNNFWWSNYGDGYQGARFYRNVNGEVHLQGLVRRSAAWSEDAKIFILPVGYRPAANLVHPISCRDSGSDDHGRLDISADGTVSWQEFDGCEPSSYLSLTGVSFRAQ